MSVMIFDAGNSIIKAPNTPRERGEMAFNQQHSPQSTTEQVFGSHISVQAATEISGYNAQYLRKLLRAKKLEGIRTNQIWLIDLASLTSFLYRAISANDMRYGPHKAWQPPF